MKGADYMNNTIDKIAYIIEHVICNFIMFLWYRVILFRCIDNATYLETAFIILLIVLIVNGICIFSTWKNDRNYISLIENLSLAWGVIVIFEYVDVLKNRILNIAAIAVIISVLMTLLILCRKIKNKRRKRQILIRRMQNIVIIWRRNFAVASLFLLIPIMVSVLINGTVLSSKTNAVKVYGKEHCFEANIDEFVNFAAEKWDKLDIQQKLDLCQKFVNCEAEYLGLSHKIVIGTSVLDDRITAYYMESEHKIVIDIDYLKNSHSYKVMQTLIHECTHAYQHELVTVYQSLDEEARNLLLFNEASVYAKEYENYINYKDDFEGYYNQAIENDARGAGILRGGEYIGRINEYLYGDQNNVN